MKTLEFSGLRHYLRHYHIQKPLNLAACAIMRHYCAIIRSQYAHKRQPLCGACAPALRHMGDGGKARKPYSMRKAYFPHQRTIAVFARPARCFLWVVFWVVFTPEFTGRIGY